MVTGRVSLLEPMDDQTVVALRHGLPTSFADVRGERSTATSVSSNRSAFPPANSDFYDACSAAQLDAFTQFSVKDCSAENMYFLMACEQLLRLPAGSAERHTLASGMHQAFSARSAPLQPNLDSANSKRVARALESVAGGHSPDNLASVLSNAKTNLLRSVGPDSYKRFLETLPR